MKKEIFAVNTSKSGQPNGCWRANSERVKNCNYVVSEEGGKVKAVYTFDGVKKHPDGRIGFKGLRRAAPRIQNKYVNREIPKKKGCANPVRYLKESF